MSRHKRWINLSLKLALNSPVSHYKHGSCLVKGGRLISLGINRNKSGVLGDRCYDLKGWHSELDCLYGLDPNDVKNAILYVGGLSKGGKIVCSKPCKYCMEYLKRFELKAIYFSSPDNTYEKLSV